MKKLLFAFAVFAGPTLSGFAQTTTSTSSSAKEGGKFSIGLEAGLPVGDVATALYSTVIGGSLKYEIPTSTSTYLTLNAGYNAFLTKSYLKDLGAPSSSGFVPLKAGIKGYTGGGFFLEGQAGVVFSTDSGGGKSFAWSAGFGYTFKGGFEAGLHYEDWTNTPAVGQAGLRIAYRF
jgi:hypothetical protein